MEGEGGVLASQVEVLDSSLHFSFHSTVDIFSLQDYTYNRFMHSFIFCSVPQFQGFLMLKDEHEMFSFSL